MKIEEWFDPYNIKHIRAFDILTQTGAWPKGFIPEDVTFSTVWYILVADKMANEWVKLKLKEAVD